MMELTRHLNFSYKLGKPEISKVKNYTVNVKKDIIKNNHSNFIIDGKEIHCEGEGNGPINALDNAIKLILKKLKNITNIFLI